MGLSENKLIKVKFVLKDCYVLFAFGPSPEMLRGYSWLFPQELFLVVLTGPCRMLGIQLTMSKASSLPVILSLRALTARF